MDTHVVEISPITSHHSQLLVFLSCILKMSADHSDSGFVFAAPYIMRCSDDLEMMPDVLYVSRERSGLIGADCLEGAADIAVEIVAHGSDPQDREVNLADYEATSVREYWLIDPEYRVATFYQRNSEKAFVPARVGDSGIYRSKVLPNLFVKTGWLWETPMPKTMVVLREWRII